MPVIRPEFRGLHTDIFGGRVPSGTADIALNVTVENGELAKRGSFEEIDADTGTVLKMWEVVFDGVTPYIIAKKGTTLIKSTDYGATFTALTTEATHGAGPGWGYVWGDRFHYVDQAGTSRYNPSKHSNVAFKDGLQRPSTAAAVGAAGGGEKEGKYHVYWAMRNSVTREEGPVVGPSSLVTTTEAGATGGIIINNWNGTLKPATLHTDYEWDQGVFYCTLGDTEEQGSSEINSLRAYIDVVTATGATSVGLNKADKILLRKQNFTNSGGLPIPCQFGCYTGSRAIYVKGSTAGKIYFSIPNFPTMVPQEELYIITNEDRTTFDPQPWVGEAISSVNGAITEVIYGGGLAVLLTKDNTYLLRNDGEGKIKAVLMHPSVGSVNTNAACATPYGIHYIGDETWSFLSRDGWKDLAYRRFQSEVRDLNALGNVCMAYYGYKNQIWAAAGDTILVLDMNASERGELTKFTSEVLGTISAMMELTSPIATPVMLVCANGKMYKYPGEGSGDGSVGYVSTWRGYFAGERADASQRLDSVKIFTGVNCASLITIGLRAMQSPAETVAQVQRTLGADGSSRWITLGAEMDPVNGHIFQMELTDTVSGGTSALWKVHDVIWKTSIF